jgi:cellulose synthase/poly-beta-1,6-N-acetylglucosamine synthase-like glycosyltransferase
MKRVSIIIPIHQEPQINPSKILSLTKLTNAFSYIDHDLRMHGIDYEIVLMVDSSTNIVFDEIEVFPRIVPIKLHRLKTAKNMSELILKGIKIAHYEFIFVLSCESKYLSRLFRNIIVDMEEGNQVSASLRNDTFSHLPFLFKMRSDPKNVALFFQKYVWNVIAFKPSTDEIFFLEFLKHSEEAGFLVKKHQIPFYEIEKTPFTRITVQELFFAARDIFLLNIKKIPPVYIPAKNSESMANAGLFYKKQKYITHTTLRIYQSALEALDRESLFYIIAGILALVAVLLVYPLLFFQTFIGILSCVYLIDVCFNVFLVFKTFQNPSELSFTKAELNTLTDEELPTYSILCPLYNESHILPQFIKGLEKLDWPKKKLDVIILLESDDNESIKVFNLMSTPTYMRSVVVPNSIPKTKPKACNYGLAFVKGSYTVIYDAEDIPDPFQLKKAYLGFKKAGSKVACLQAKLNYYNADQNLLTRFFTAEYSLWFDLILTGLYSLQTIVPLGGTSNHFRTEDLKKLHAWDPFNVTEDADLGLRLFKLGYHTAILDSVTLEEGNSQVKNWLRQRSRWIKGYMQTYLVHTKENISFFRKRGFHAIIFHLVIGGKLAFIIINPILWIVTLLYFTLYWLVGPTIDTFYPPFVLYVAITSLIFGNYLYLFCHLMGCVKKEQWSLIKYVYLIPLYWILISIAGFMALHQLIFKPFYWEKTVHGLHLKNKGVLTKAFPESPIETLPV